MKQFIVTKNESQRTDVWYELDEVRNTIFMKHQDGNGNSKYGFAGFLRKENNRGWTIETYSLTGSSTVLTLGRGFWEKTEIEP